MDGCATPQRREEILSKDFLGISDVMELLGVDRGKAGAIIKKVKYKSDRLGIQGKIHLQDYIDAFNLDIARYVVGGEKNESRD